MLVVVIPSTEVWLVNYSFIEHHCLHYVNLMFTDFRQFREEYGGVSGGVGAGCLKYLN